VPLQSLVAVMVEFNQLAVSETVLAEVVPTGTEVDELIQTGS